MWCYLSSEYSHIKYGFKDWPKPLNRISHRFRMIDIPDNYRLSDLEHTKQQRKQGNWKEIQVTPEDVCKPINMNCQLSSRFLIQRLWALVDKLLIFNAVTLKLYHHVTHTKLIFFWRKLACRGLTTGKHNASSALLAWSGGSSVITVLG